MLLLLCKPRRLCELCRVGKKGWTFSDQLADFQLLLYLCNFLSPQDDLPRLCKAVTDREVPLDDGYQLLIRSIAGMD
jgi:nuclear protein localization family protein 4